jgi:signal peptidase I
MSEPVTTTERKVAEKPEVFSARTVRPNGREGEPKAESKEVGPPKTIIREYFESAVVTVIMALFGMTFIVQAVKVPTASMENTILVGDHLLVNKFVFAPGPSVPILPQREIRRGDIVVFKYPGNPFNQERDKEEDNIPYKVNYVKRVIGLPGDTVEVRGLRVFVNGEPLPEHIVAVKRPLTELDQKAPLQIVNETPRRPEDRYNVYYYSENVEAVEKGGDLLPSADFHFALNGKPDKVPANHYFVMGDDRDNSLDGRAWGFVPRDLIIGRAMFVYWSYDETQPFGPKEFFANTRWSRTLTMVK